MKTHLKTKLTFLLTLLIGTVAPVSPCRSVEIGGAQMPSPTPHYDSPRSPAIADGLKQCIADFDRAQRELRDLYAEGRVSRQRNAQGFWAAYIEVTNGFFSATFRSESGPVKHLARRVFTSSDLRQELPALGYEVYYDTQGKAERYRRRDGGESLWLYPNGAPSNLWVKVDSYTAGQVSWNQDGKIQSEGISPQFPRDEKTLPELEDALRHADERKQWAAVETMAGIGPASIPYALNVLKDGDAHSRQLAVGVLQRLGKRAASTVPILVRDLREDKSIDVRNRIAVCLGAMGASAEAAIPALEEAATNDIPAVATAAKTSLGFIRNALQK